MLNGNKLTKARRDQYMIIALCAISDCLYEELVDDIPYARTSWKRIGVPKSSLDKSRDLVRSQGKCFEALHTLVRKTICPDPPCLKEGFLEGIYSAASEV